MFYTFRLTAVFIYTYLAYNMKEKFHELERSELNQCAGVHNKMKSENLFNKDNAYVTELSDKDWKRIKEMITEESEKSRNLTENILDTRLKQELKKIIQIKGIFLKLFFTKN